MGSDLRASEKRMVFGRAEVTNRTMKNIDNKTVSKITSAVIAAAMMLLASSCSLNSKPAETESESVPAATATTAESEETTASDTEATWTVTKSDISNIYSFENGICQKSGKLWTEYYYDVLEKLDKDTEPGSWHSVYGPDSDSMFDDSDYVRFWANNKLTSAAYFRHTDEKFNCESCTVGVTNISGELKAGIGFTYEQGQNPWEDGTLNYKFMYKLDIDVAPGEFDKVFESKEALAGSCTLMLCVLDGKDSYHEVWSSVSEEEIKKMFNEEGCTYYTKDQIIDMFWNDHSRILKSIDYGMNEVMDTSLADAGINWK